MIDYVKYLRNHIYLDRLGGGLASNLVDVVGETDDELKGLILSRKWNKRKIRNLIRIQRRVAAKFNNTELNKLVKLESKWIKQLSKDLRFYDVDSDAVIASALARGMAVNNQSVGSLFESAFARKEETTETLSGMVTNSIKGVGLAEAEYAILLSQFARALEVAERTFVHSMGHEMRDRMFKQNADVLRGVVMSAVLDGRTSKYCMGIDGDIFPVDEGPRPEFHPRCRTLAIPLTSEMTDQDVEDMLAFRPQVGPGQNFVKGDASSLRAHKYQKDQGLVKVQPSGVSKKASRNYANFLAAQSNTPEGVAFIEDMIGVKKSRRFIRLIDQGRKPESVLESVLYDVKAKDLDMEGFKKRLKT